MTLRYCESSILVCMQVYEGKFALRAILWLLKLIMIHFGGDCIFGRSSRFFFFFFGCLFSCAYASYHNLCICIPGKIINARTH